MSSTPTFLLPNKIYNDYYLNNLATIKEIYPLLNTESQSVIAHALTKKILYNVGYSPDFEALLNNINKPA